MIVKNNVRKYRVFKGLTQKELAHKLKISIKQVRDIEIYYKNPKYQVRNKICKFFNVSLNQMFWEEK